MKNLKLTAQTADQSMYTTNKTYCSGEIGSKADDVICCRNEALPEEYVNTEL